MKKGLLILLASVLLTGCESNETVDDNNVEPELSTITCVMDDVSYDGYTLDSEYIVNYNGDYVDNVVTTETVTSDSEDILDYMEEYLNQTYQVSSDTYGGYTYDISRSSNQVSANVTIDYNIMDLDQFQEDQPSISSYIEDGKFLVSGIVEMYESFGATCE